MKKLSQVGWAVWNEDEKRFNQNADAMMAIYPDKKCAKRSLFYWDKENLKVIKVRITEIKSKLEGGL